MCRLCLERASGKNGKLLTKEEWRLLSPESRHKLNSLIESKCTAMKLLETLCPQTKDYLDNPGHCYRFISECRVSANASLVKAASQRDHNAGVIGFLVDVLLSISQELSERREQAHEHNSSVT
jgi:hypothetical protein